MYINVYLYMYPYIDRYSQNAPFISPQVSSPIYNVQTYINSCMNVYI